MGEHFVAEPRHYRLLLALRGAKVTYRLGTHLVFFGFVHPLWRWMFPVPLLAWGIRALRHRQVERLDWGVADTWCCWSCGRFLHTLDRSFFSWGSSRNDALWSWRAHQNQGHHLPDNAGICLHGAQCLLSNSRVLGW